MTNESLTVESGVQAALPKIRQIGLADLKEALARGLDDFKAKPSHIFILVAIYPLIGLFLYRAAFGANMLPLLFPLVAGFALIGPLAAIGLYELSRVREAGGEISWSTAANIFRASSILPILALATLQMAIYFAWLGAAWGIYKLNFGDVLPASMTVFADMVFTTSSGWWLIVTGCGIGFLFAIVVLAISAISSPMLIDGVRNPAVALHTSVRAVLANPIIMTVWGLIVALALIAGSLPFFLGLAFVMPVLGHATWHLYRKIVDY